MNCITCGNPLTGNKKKYCSRKCSNVNHQNYITQRKRGILRKRNFVLQLGSKCSVCGYDKNLAALCFHHLNKDEKSIDLTMQRFSNSTLEKLEFEVRKCVLLCANCHMELHYPDYLL